MTTTPDLDLARTSAMSAMTLATELIGYFGEQTRLITEFFNDPRYGDLPVWVDRALKDVLVSQNADKIKASIQRTLDEMGLDTDSA